MGLLVGTRRSLLGSGGRTLLTDLVSYWKLDEASGIHYDAHDDNNLSDQNAVTRNLGIIKYTGQFTRVTSQMLHHADNPSLSVGDIDFTCASWVYQDGQDAVNVIISQYDNGTADRAWWIAYLQASDRFEFRVSSDGTAQANVDADNLGSPSTGQWYFVVGWHDAINNTINIQVNNGAVDSVAYALGVHNSVARFCMGASLTNNNGTNYMSGRIDETGFWKRILTAEERTRLYIGYRYIA